MKNFKLGNKLLAYLTAGVISLSTASVALADYETVDDCVVTNGESYIYDSVGDNHEVIGSFNAGESLDRLLTNGEYSLVRSGKLLGFVSNSFIDHVSNNDNSHYDYEELEENGYTNSKVKIRNGPSTSYKKIDIVDNGAKVKILGRVNNGWYLVDYNNTIGFMCGDYVDLVDTELFNADVPELTPIIIAKETVNIRAEARKDSNDLGDLHTGESLEFVRLLDNGWYEVIYNGSYAYIKGDYVYESYKINDDLDKIVYFKKDSRVTTSTDGNGFLAPEYEAGYVYSTSGNYYFGIVDGRVGFFRKSDVETLKGTFVIVDISDQKLKLYKDGTEEVLFCDVITGKDSSPTSIGCFKVGSKDTDTYLVGPGYRCHVDYWIPFNHGQGMHDADGWRSDKEYNGTTYKKKGSHGCVNMKKKDVKVVYNTVKRGDKVLVKK